MRYGGQRFAPPVDLGVVRSQGLNSQAPHLWRGAIMGETFQYFPFERPLIIPEKPDNVNDALTRVVTSRGLAGDNTSGSTRIVWGSSNGADRFHVQNWTIACAFTVPSGWSALSSRTIFQTGGRLDMGFNPSNSSGLVAGELAAIWFDGSFRTITTGVSSFTPGDFHAVVFTGIRGGFKRIYLDGDEKDSLSTGSDVSFSVTRDSSIGAATWDNSRDESDVYLNSLWWWDRALSPAEARQWSLDPFEMMRPRPILVSVPAGGATNVTPAAATYAAYTGQAISTSFATSVTVTAATYAAYTGQNYTVATGATFEPAAGTYQPYTGQNTDLTLAKSVTMAAATYAAYTGQAIQVAVAKVVEVAAGAMAVLIGQDISVVKAKSVEVAAATWQYVGRAYDATYAGEIVRVVTSGGRNMFRRRR